MKKLLVLFLCLTFLFTTSACGKKDNPNAPISSINTAQADKENPEQDNQDENQEEFNPDRTEETDRKEIETNLRDARELIENGYFEDAKMIIDGLKTRDLTPAEKDELLELQKKMITVSD